jgi:hypothetical protein
MAMTKKLYSISGLATELGRDRRTLAKRLNGIPPDGVLPGGHKGWFLTTALASLDNQPSDPPSEDKLFGYPTLCLARKPVDRAIIMTALTLFYRIGLTAATVAVAAGAEMKVAYAIHNIILTKLGYDISDLLAEWGVEGCLDPDNAILFEPEAIEKVDWRVLAAHAGEKLDLDGWQKWLKTNRRFAPDEKEA